MTGRRDDGSTVTVRGAGWQIALNVGVLATVVTCAFFVGGIWFEFKAVAAESKEISAVLPSIRERLARIESKLEPNARPDRGGS